MREGVREGVSEGGREGVREGGRGLEADGKFHLPLHVCWQFSKM